MFTFRPTRFKTRQAAEQAAEDELVRILTQLDGLTFSLRTPK